MRDPAIAGWGEFGLVIQAYSKRCLPVLVWLTLLGRELGARIPLRLVKGPTGTARSSSARSRGWTVTRSIPARKAPIRLTSPAPATCSEHTRGVIYPQFASHNAHTVSCILTWPSGRRSRAEFEFQRLHGMGDALYDTVIEKYRKNVRIYAPVGAHKDLLPYLRAACWRTVPTRPSSISWSIRACRSTLIDHPVSQLRRFAALGKPRIPLPPALYGNRKNSQGINMNIQQQWNELASAYQPSSIVTAGRAGDRRADPGRYAVRGTLPL